MGFCCGVGSVVLRLRGLVHWGPGRPVLGCGGASLYCTSSVAARPLNQDMELLCVSPGWCDMARSVGYAPT